MKEEGGRRKDDSELSFFILPPSSFILPLRRPADPVEAVVPVPPPVAPTRRRRIFLSRLPERRYPSYVPGLRPAPSRGRDARRPALAGELAVSVELAVRNPNPVGWPRRHLLDLEDLSRAEIETILDTAEGFLEVSQRRRKKLTSLKGK